MASATETRRRQWLQYGVGSLLFVMFLLSGMFAGYRAGYYQGAEAKRRQSIGAKVYHVADLVHAPGEQTQDFDTLVDLITSSIRADSWSDVGGPGSIAIYPENDSLVVTATGEIHDEVAELIDELRKSKGPRRPDRDDSLAD